MPKKAKITEEEQTTFRAAMRGVTPIQHTKTTQEPPLPAPRLLKRVDNVEPEVDIFSDYESLPSVSSDEILQYYRPGIQHKILRNLRNGKYNVEAKLDLHGKTVAEARQTLTRFLQACKEQNIRHVLIIHGKGRNTNQPILKNKLNHWLRQTEQVLAFSSATGKDGRGGALYVLLKS
ncbi:MAG: Smr/MutS family protein [Gammaproteobacteria bacterium]